MAGCTSSGSNDDLDALEALAGYLHDETEERSRAFARELHDHVGGSLIAAIMDVAWLSRHPGAAGEDVSMRLHRVEESLTSAIESTRHVVDELRPALISSVGLFVAVSAHVGRECRRHGIKYSATLGSAPCLDTGSAITVFRIAQGLLQWIREDAGADELHACFEGDSRRLSMRFVARGTRGGRLPSPRVSPRLASIALRLRKLKGTLRSEAVDGRVTIQVEIPSGAPNPPDKPA